MIQIEEEKVTKYRCSEHGRLDGPKCPTCDKCEHGITSSGYCDKCRQKYGNAWALEPITKTEFEWIQRQVGSCGIYRHNPYPRCFETLDLVQKMTIEYGKARGFIK